MIQRFNMTLKKIEKKRSYEDFFIIHEDMILFEFNTIPNIEDLFVK